MVKCIFHRSRGICTYIYVDMYDKEKESRVLGIVGRIKRVKKMGKEGGEVRKRRIDRKRRVDFGEAYQLRQRLNTKDHRDKRAWVVSLLPVDFIFSRRSPYFLPFAVAFHC